MARPTAATSARLTRLVATLGPASIEHIPALVEAGLDVARINLSHGSRADHERAAREVRSAAASAGRAVAILVDLPGPKLRLGQLPSGSVDLLPGEVIELSPWNDGVGSDRPHPGWLPVDAPGVLGALRRGDRILLADGAAELRVAKEGRARVRAEVVRGGRIRSHAGLNVPAERLPDGGLTPADVTLLPHVLELGPDVVGQSFVRAPADVRALRQQLPVTIGIIAKIETRPAVDAIAGILAAADGIMVARGDLGVELPFEEVPLIQKDLVRAALAAGKPSIVATQMLESMIEAPRPTRAEASDVANAVLDGADAVMLSGETAIGAFPTLALEAAARICRAAEVYASGHVSPLPIALPGDVDPDARALALAGCALAEAHPDVAAIACFTRTGRTARLLAALRPRVPIVALTPSTAVARALAVHRGVLACAAKDADGPRSFKSALRANLVQGIGGWMVPADRAVVLVASSAGGAGGPNLVEVIRT